MTLIRSAVLAVTISGVGFTNVTRAADTVTFDDKVGPCCFVNAGPAQTLTYTFPDGETATFNGGVVLTGESNQSTDNTSVYATTSFTSPGFNPTVITQNPLSITFSQPVSKFQVQTLNANAGAYLITDNNNNSNSFSLAVSGGSISTTTKAANLGGNKIQIGAISAPWDFAIDNVSFTPNTPQNVYLDFSAAPNATVGPNSTPYNKPASGLSGADITAITNAVQGIYTKYNVNFTDAPPASGPYDTVYIGGTTASVSAAANLNAGTLGIAHDINIGNSNPSDTAIIFSGDANYFTNDATIAQVVAHETGHILGLFHVNDPNQLMYPFASATATTIGGSTPLGAIMNGSVVSIAGTQDSNGVLLCNVGDRQTQNKTCSGLIGYQNIAFATASTMPTIYDAEIVYLGPDTDPDTGPPIYYLGTLDPNTSESLLLPVLPDDTFEVVGAFSEGGPLDMLVSEFTNSTLTITGAVAGPVPEPGTVPEPNGALVLLTSLGFLTCLLYERRRSAQF